MKLFLTIICLCTSLSAAASTTDCLNLQIGRIWVERGTGLKAVVYLNSRGDSSGSYWSYFNTWTAEDKKDAHSLLMAAKLSNHPVNVVTTSADGCGLQAGGTETRELFLATNP